MSSEQRHDAQDRVTTTAVLVVPEGDHRDLQVRRIPVAPLRPDEALVEVAYGGICGSDLHYWTHGSAGTSILRHPMVLGHEIVGAVVQAAANGSGPEAGTAVAVHPATPGEVEGVWYPPESPHLSPGGTYLGSAAHDPHCEGGFARLLPVPTRMLRAIPEGLSLREAALAEPASVALHAVRGAGGVSGRKVLVIGAGPIGALVIAALKREGAAHIVATDLHASALERAERLGAQETLIAPSAETLEGVQADVTIECSGSAPGLNSALHGTVRGGTLVMVGMLPPGPQPVEVSLAIGRELTLVGSFRFHEEMDEVLTALADGTLDVGPVVSHTLPVADAVEAFTIALDAASSGKVLLDFSEADAETV